MRPVDSDAGLEAVQQFVGDDAKLLVAHDFNGAFVVGQGVIKGDFVRGQALLLAALPGGADVPGEVNEFLNHLGRGDGVVVIAGDRVFEALGESPRLRDVRLAVGADFPVQELAQGFQGEVFLCQIWRLFDPSGDSRMCISI